MDELINTALYTEGKLVYKKLKNRYRIYCMKCRRYEYVSKDEMKQIRASRICPMCFEDIIPTTVLQHGFVRYIMDDNYNGYRVYVGFRFGFRLRTSIVHCCRYKGGSTCEARYIARNMGCSFYYNPQQDQWKKRNSQSYLWCFNTIHKSKTMSKKEYIYSALFDEGHKSEQIDRIVKSNQKKIMQNYLLNGRQMEYIIAFDLKSYDQVYRYRTYIRENRPDIYRSLNVYYLDYLYRNRIRIRDFYDYMDHCRELGFRLDKPSDFQQRHLALNEMIMQKRKEDNVRNIKKRYARLIKKAYVDGDVEIKPFKDDQEIRNCGKQLHNCIGSYIEKYAQERTDLYYLSLKGRKKVAIEVRNKRLIQARTDRNGECPSKYIKHIRKWCDANRFIEDL